MTLKPILASLAAAMALAAALPAAAVDNYPERPIRMVVPFGAGGGTDILARIIATELPQRLGQEVFIENRGGGGSAVGTVYAMQQAPDGETLLFQSSAFTINTALQDNLPYDAINDLAPISLLASGPVVLVAHPSSGITSLDEMLERARSAPGTLRFATGGPGSSPHLVQELLKSVTDTDYITVHFGGSGPAIIDLLGGHVELMFAGVSQSAEHIDAGSLIPLAITGAQRSRALPDVPTFTELDLADIDGGTFWGVLAPAGTPEPIIDKLSGIFAEVMELPQVVERLDDLGFNAIGSTPAEYATNIRDEIERWTRVIEEAGIEPN